jgi:UDP-N-acetylglucosamine 1-carboxyvinyltransferase
MYLEEASVTGTETALLGAAAATGRTEFRHAATEPHVAELCQFLRKMGAAVSGEGSSTIRIEGASKLHGVEHRLNGDYIEAGSWAVVAAVTGGAIEVTGARADDVETVTAILTRMNVDCDLEDNLLRVNPSRPTAIRRITTGLWPGFPSDIVSLVTVLATQAEGRTLVHDWMYELRLFALEQLSGMNADLFLCDPHRIIVTGPTKLRPRPLDSRDLRSRMALPGYCFTKSPKPELFPLSAERTTIFSFSLASSVTALPNSFLGSRYSPIIYFHLISAPEPES